MKRFAKGPGLVLGVLAAAAFAAVLMGQTGGTGQTPPAKPAVKPAPAGQPAQKLAPAAPIPVPNAKPAPFDQVIDRHLRSLLSDGRNIYRYDTFGSEAFWGGVLQLHNAIQGEKFGGVGAGLTPKAALGVGLKVDMDALPPPVQAALKAGQVNLDDPATTLTLLKADAVVGVRGAFDAQGRLTAVGITCAICHSTVDDAFAPGIGHRLDGWPAQDLNVGAIVSLAPNLQVVAQRLHVDVATLKKVLGAWGPGFYDAEVLEDGKATRPDGKPGPTKIPPSYGLAGMNLHTWTGWGSVPYWNAYVAVTQMHGQGTFFDPRMNDKARFPLAVENKDWNIKSNPDMVTSKLSALHVYQIAIPAPNPPVGSFNAAAATRGEALFNDKAQCARCHTPPLFMEPGWSMHTAAELGIDDFQANRSPNQFYRTAPLRGLWSRVKRGFYHDGRFATLADVITHYDTQFKLGLAAAEKTDLAEYLKSIGDVKAARRGPTGRP